MQKLSKKLIIGIVIFLIIIIIMLLLYFKNSSSNVLFKSSYINHAWGYADYGYIIYENGVIQQYDNSDEKRIENLKKDKITKKELSQLKKLANKVEDKYKKKESNPPMQDAGISENIIYSNKLSKFVVLSRSGDLMENNFTETSIEILNLTEKLYNKYLNDENKQSD